MVAVVETAVVGTMEMVREMAVTAEMAVEMAVVGGWR